MGTYDRSLQWRMMQQRHPHSSLTTAPYFASGFSALGTTAGGERRSSTLQSLCSTNSSNTNESLASVSSSSAPTTNYYTSTNDDRSTPMLKRQRLNKLSPGTRTSSSSSSGGPQRANALASYLPSAVESSYSTNNSAAANSYQPTSTADNYTNSAPPQDFTHDGWFQQRGSVSGSTGLSVNTAHANYAATATDGGTTTTNSSNGGGSSSSGLGRSLASPTTMFGMENLMADYESGFYSLWNGSNGANVMGYESESPPPPPPTDRHAPSGSTHVYMPDEELKMDYPQLPDLNQGDLDYIYGTMDASSSTGRHNEPHVDPPRTYTSTNDLHRSTKRDRASSSDDHHAKLGSGLLSPTQTSLMSPLPPSAFRSLARATTMETKRPASHRSQAMSSFHGESASASHATTPVGTATTTNSSNTSAAAAARLPSSSSLGSAAGGKRPRSRQCDFPGCENRARSHQKCKKHGGAHQCVYEGCMKNSQSRGLCIAHGGGSRCKVDGCTRASQSKGRCKSHGGGEFCAVEGCRKKAHLKHLCRTHGGGVRCKDPKCMKWAQRKGWCMAHAKEVLGS